MIVADIIGTGDDVGTLLQTSAEDSAIPDNASLLLFAVGSSGRPTTRPFTTLPPAWVGTVGARARRLRHQ